MYKVLPSHKAQATETTPPLVFQTWKTKKLPKHLQKLYNKWDGLCKKYGYEHILYTDEDLRNFVKDNFPQYLQLYDSFTNPLERVDFARYVILYVHGGVYSDLDVMPLKPIDRWLSMNRIVLGTEPKEHRELLYKDKKVVLCNAFMISPPKQEIWKNLLEYIASNYKPYSRVVYNTGPMAMTNFYDAYPFQFKNVIILGACEFYPLLDERYGGNTQNVMDDDREKHTFTNVSKECDIKDSYVAHMWNHDGYQGFDMEFLDPRNWALAVVIILYILLIFPPYMLKK